MNSSQSDIALSKFLSLILRHQPEVVGLTLDDAGWVSVDELIAACTRHGRPFTRSDLEQVVATSDKKRYAFDPSGTLIRANQGHSVAVDLQYEPRTPPMELFHGTATRFLDTIRVQGLLEQARHHVHLSPDQKTAVAVGARHGRPVVLSVRAAEMHRVGHAFYLSENGVWLVDHVPPTFLTFPE